MTAVPPPPPIEWEQIVELARQAVRSYRAHGTTDVELGLRLAYAVLAFQEQLVGNAGPRRGN